MTKVVSAVCTLLACGVVAVGNAAGGPVALYESIESTGAQSVLLDDVIASPTLQAVLDFVPLEHTGMINIGTLDGGDDSDWRFFSYSGGAIFDAGSARIGLDPSKVLTLGVRQIASFGVESNTVYLRVEDAETGAKTIELSGNLTGTVAAKSVYAFYPDTKMRVYSLKLYDFKNPGDTTRSLIADLVPCAGGVYDLVTGKSYLTTAGADAFVMGERKSLVDFETTAAYDPAAKQLTVSTLLKAVDNPQDLLFVLTGADGVATTNVIRKAATASETPYELVLNDLPEDATLLPRFIAVDAVSGLPVTEFFDVFYTGEISMTPGSDADSENGSEGYFTVSRGDSAAAAAHPLTVNYTVGGTAVGGADYVALSGTVTIPAGASSARVSIVQLVNAGADDKTLSLTLAAGNYAIDAEANAAQIAVKPLASCWTYDPATGQMTDGDWVFGMGLVAAGDTKLFIDRVITQGQSSVLKLNTPISNGAYTLHAIWGWQVFNNNGFITEVWLPNTLKEITNNTFNNCSALTAVHLSENLTVIGDGAFNACRNLVTVEPFLPATLTYLGGSAFEWCDKLEGSLTLGQDGGAPLTLGGWRNFFRDGSITNIVFKSNVTWIPNNFFEQAYWEVAPRLRSVTFAPTITGIGNSAFQHCTNLIEVTLPEKLTHLGDAVFNTCLNLERVTPALPRTLTYLGGQAFENCYKLGGEWTLGDDAGEPLAIGGRTFLNCYEITKMTVKGNVTAIPNSFLENGQMLDALVIPEGLVSIGDSAFPNCCRLRSVMPLLPESVTYVGGSAFNNCYRLAGDLVAGTGDGDPVTLGGRSFYGCSQITSATFGPRVTVINDHIFEGASGLLRVTAHDGITTIHDGAFTRCSSLQEFLPSPTPAGLTGLGGSVFSGCSSLGGEVALGMSEPVSIWGGSQFEGTRIARATFGAGTTVIPERFCVNNSALESLDLGDSQAEVIGNNAFEACTGLKGTVRLPANLKTIGSSAFTRCYKLEALDPFLSPTVTAVGGSAFNECTSLGGDLVFDPDDDAGGELWGWSFRYTAISSVTYGNAVTNVRDHCFEWCSALKSVKLSDRVCRIEESAFANCPQLESVTPFLPPTLRYINNAFNTSPKLKGDLVFGSEEDGAEPLTEIWGQPFNDCQQIASATIGKNVAVAEIPWWCFRRCWALRNVYVLADVPWQGDAFNDIYGYQFRFVVDKNSEYWDAFIADESKCRLPTVSEIERYHADWPGEPDPRGVTVVSPINQWVVSYGMVTPGQKDLTIAGKPGLWAPDEVEPKYGLHANVGGSFPATLTAPRYAATNDVLFECRGYVVETPSVKGWGAPVTNEIAGTDNPRAVKFGFDEDGARRFSWLWVPVGYQASITLPSDSSIGTVTCSDPGLEGHYAAGTTATFTAEAGDDAVFVRWHGDVPEDQAYNAEITIVMDGTKTLMPEFASAWVFTPSWGTEGTISDGFWTLKAWMDENRNVSIGQVQVNYALGILDLTKPIKDGGQFTVIGNSAFDWNTVLKEIRLPDTIVTIGDCAFRGCTSLETVTPFLPDSVTLIQSQAFNGCTKLAGALRYGFNEGTTIWGTDHFRSTLVTDVRIGLGVTDIANSTFDTCTMLTNVVAHDGITHIGDCAFRSCGNLRAFSPLLPASLTWLQSQAFNGCGQLGGNLRVSPTGTPIEFWGTDHFTGSAITNAEFGSGVAYVPQSFIRSCGKLMRVTMDCSVTNLGQECIRGCGALEYVKLSDKLAILGHGAFWECGALTTVEPFLPDTLISIAGDNNFAGCGKLVGPLVIGDGKTPIDLPGSSKFASMWSLREIVLGKHVETFTGNDVFNSSSGIKRFYLKTRTHFGYHNFWNWGAYNTIFYVPKESAEWMADIRNPALCTRWKDLHRDLQDAFRDRFPGEKEPYGLLTTGFDDSYTYAPANQWVKTWKTTPGTKLLFR